MPISVSNHKRATSRVTMIPVFGPHTPTHATPDFFLPKTQAKQHAKLGYLKSIMRGHAYRLTAKVKPPQLRGTSCKISARLVESLILGSERAAELIQGWEEQHHALIGKLAKRNAARPELMPEVSVVRVTAEELEAMPGFTVLTPGEDPEIYRAYGRHVEGGDDHGVCASSS